MFYNMVTAVVLSPMLHPTPPAIIISTPIIFIIASSFEFGGWASGEVMGWFQCSFRKTAAGWGGGLSRRGKHAVIRENINL